MSNGPARVQQATESTKHSWGEGTYVRPKDWFALRNSIQSSPLPPRDLSAGREKAIRTRLELGTEEESTRDACRRT
jgi:hypothetical protein